MLPQLKDEANQTLQTRSKLWLAEYPHSWRISLLRSKWPGPYSGRHEHLNYTAPTETNCSDGNQGPSGDSCCSILVLSVANGYPNPFICRCSPNLPCRSSRVGRNLRCEGANGLLAETARVEYSLQSRRSS